MRIRLIAMMAALGALPLCGAAPAQQAGGEVVIANPPGKVVVGQQVERVAKVTAIDPATRTLTLRVSGGRSVDIVAGDEVRNFSQIRVGDDVTAVYMEALTLSLRNTRAPLAASGEERGARAEPGERPAGVVGREIHVIAEVVAVDPQKSTISLKGPQGRVVDLLVRNPEHFKHVKVGDQVDATYTQAVAVAVTAAARK